MQLVVFLMVLTVLMGMAVGIWEAVHIGAPMWVLALNVAAPLITLYILLVLSDRRRR